MNDSEPFRMVPSDHHYKNIEHETNNELSKDELLYRYMRLLKERDALYCDHNEMKSDFLELKTQVEQRRKIINLALGESKERKWWRLYQSDFFLGWIAGIVVSTVLQKILT